jgi:putative ABC transport system permease protein
MKLRDIALSNIRRRKAKVAFLLAGLMVGVATVVALVSITITLNRDIEEKLDRFGANIVISPRTEGLSLAYGGMNLGGVSYNVKEISSEEVARIDSIKNRKNIKVISPKTLGVVEASTKSVLLAGIDVPRELEMKQWWQIEGRAPEAENEVLAGSIVAESLRLAPGSSVAVKGKELKVAGVIGATGSQDDEILFASIATAQSLLGKEGLYSIVEVSALCRDCPVEELVAQISEQIPTARVSAVQQVVKSKMQALDHLVKLTLGISAVVFFIGVLIVLVTMMGSIKERTREIGIFRAIGFRQGHIIRIILLEAVIVSFAAGVLGWIFGIGVASVSIPLFAEGESGAIAVNLLLAAGAVGMAVLTGLLSSIYPAMKAVRMAPNEALRILY